MATLRQAHGERRQPLGAAVIIGRAPSCDLVLSEATVSSEHASLRWTGERWVLRDLGSRNGTWVDGRRLPVGDRSVLRQGQELAFGRMENAWILEAAGAPEPYAQVLGPARTVEGESGLLVIGDEDAPDLAVYQGEDGRWVVERDGGLEQVEHLSQVEAGGQRWRLHLPEFVPPTEDAPRGGTGVQAMSLTFRVSQHEEHVQIVGELRGRRLDLKARAHHYMLLTLARARLADAEDPELPVDARGWRHVEQVCDMLRVDEQALNLAVFRARKQLAKQGVPGAAQLIQRRPDSRELRLGVGDLAIETL